MKISQQELESIIKEELDTAIDEGWLDRLSARGQGAMSSADRRSKPSVKSWVANSPAEKTSSVVHTRDALCAARPPG